MPNRVIKESIKRSPQIDSLTWFEEVVFYRLMVTVDDFGCTDGRINVLRSDLFPTKDTITKKALEDALNKLVRVGLVQRYEAEGAPYLFLVTWERHQRIRNKRRKFPLPPIDGQLSADCCQLTADCPPESESESKSESETESKLPASALPPPQGAGRQAAGGSIQQYPAEARELCAYFEENCHRRRSIHLLNAFTRSLLDGASADMLRAVVDETALAGAKSPAAYVIRILDDLRGEKVRDLAAYRTRNAEYKKQKERRRNADSSGNPDSAEEWQLTGVTRL